MTRARRIQVLRFWLLTALTLAACLLWPALVPYLFGSFALTPLGLFMPVFTSCELFADPFTTDQTATAWSIRSGSWSVSGGLLSTSSASGVIRCETAMSAGATGAHVTVNATIDLRYEENNYRSGNGQNRGNLGQKAGGWDDARAAR